ncbi:PKD domain-containing protein [Sphingomonas sp. PB2P19]|uniref:PKD domain-containing protein n=1 Tax=Sphingomonas rhamnosi TaxID=3096156 RepID=UPI002FCC901C
MANRGRNQNVLTTAFVTLDASDSVDADGDPLTYKWSFKSRPTGSGAVLSSSTDAKPTFTADVTGTYVATLIVNDGKIDSAPADATITATVVNAVPVANAGPNQNVSNGVPVTLDGSASSDADRHGLIYLWFLYSQPTGSQATLSNRNIANPTFTPDVAGKYVLRLIVNDGYEQSAVDSVTITSSSSNSVPVANAGKDKTVVTQSTVALDGISSSDANGNPLRYAWNLTSKPAGSTASLTTTRLAATNFTADLAGTYVATLIVNDGVVDSVPDTVAITAVTSVSPILALYTTDSFTNESRLAKLPYTAAENTSLICLGTNCTPYTIGKFSLAAGGGDFTIQDVKAENLTPGSSVAVSIRNLKNGAVVSAGQVVGFELTSGLTRGQRVKLRYSFSIKETGDTFSYSITLTTN